MQQFGFPDGAVRFIEQLRRYIDHMGASGKYHETITWAYLVLMNEEMALRGTRDEPFEAMAARCPDLLNHRGGRLSRIYTREQLDDAAARRVFMLPRANA